MSRYPLAPDGYQALVGPGWNSYSGSVAGGNLSDGSDSTGIRYTGSGQSSWLLRFSTRTVPDNEIAVGVSPTVRSRRTTGSRVAIAAVALNPSGTVLSANPPASMQVCPSASGFSTGLSVQSVERVLTQAEVDALALLLTVPAGTSPTTLDISEASITLVTTSRVQKPVIASPSGTVTDTTRPRVAWTHMDRTVATVTNKASSGTTRTLTIGTHTWLVGQSVGVDIADDQYVPASAITAVTGTTISYTGTGNLSQSTSASGTAWIGDDKPQSAARVLVVNQAQYSAPGFTPDKALASGDYVWTALMYSLQVADCPVDLANTNYRAYVRTAAQYGSVTTTSDWEYAAWVQAVTPASAPILGAAYDEPTNRVSITAAGQTNMITAKQSSLEPGGTAGAWDTPVNCALSVQSTYAASGVNSLRLRSSASGAMSARMVLPVAAGVRARVTPGKTYCASAAFRAGAAARSCRVDIQWIAADATTILSTTTGTAGNDATGSWSTRTVSGTAPTDAVYARLLLTVLSTGAANEDHFVDQIGLWPGATPPAWTPGVTPDGMTATDVLTVELLIERSTDEATWVPVRVPPDATAGAVGIVLDATTQYAAIYDHEAPRGGSVYYRASVVILVNGGAPFASSVAGAAVVTTGDWHWWLSVIEDPSLRVASRLVEISGFSAATDTQAESYPLFAGGTFLTAHPAAATERDVEWTSESVEEYEALLGVLRSGRRLLLQSVDVASDGFLRQWYCQPVGSVTETPVAPSEGIWQIGAHLVEQSA